MMYNTGCWLKKEWEQRSSWFGAQKGSKSWDFALGFLLPMDILSYATPSAVKHRVVHQNDNSPNGEGFVPTKGPEHERMAATLFCRPKPSAVLGTLPSPLLFVAGRGTPPAPVMTFEEWMAKTAKNYQKAKLNKSQHSH